MMRQSVPPFDLCECHAGRGSRFGSRTHPRLWTCSSQRPNLVVRSDEDAMPCLKLHNERLKSYRLVGAERK